jgi:hypothetical protein
MMLNRLSKHHALDTKLFYQANNYANLAENTGDMAQADKWRKRAEALSLRMAICLEKMRLLEAEFYRVQDGGVITSATPSQPLDDGMLGIKPGGPVGGPGN